MERAIIVILAFIGLLAATSTVKYIAKKLWLNKCK